ncbi:Structural maintenance of chromosomes protein 6 [Yarrowia sp. B02]|nr:Structural maintenance of chromosomes protein 6 [Yarrowia sp. B02]
MTRKRSETPDDDDTNTRPRKRQARDFFRYHHPGFVRTVECVNFMCHRNLKVEVGPGITFVSGQNGHGKSAILTALIQVFSTDRRMKGERGTVAQLRRNIENGKKARSAKITVTINNTEADEELSMADQDNRGYTMAPYKPETYGDVIIVEKEIMEKSRKLRIMSADRKVVSDKQETLAAIMKHFQYQFDNRLVIQTQENAKKRGDPKSNFDFFYSGSGFEKIDDDLKRMKEEIDDQKALIQHSLLPNTAAKKAARDRLKTELELTAHTKGLYDELDRTVAMLKWLKYEIVKRELDGKVTAKVKVEHKCGQLRLLGEERREKLEELRGQLQPTDPALDVQINAAQRQLSLFQGEARDALRELRSSESDVRDLEKQIRDLNRSIEHLRAERDVTGSTAEQDRLDAKIRDLDSKIEDREGEVRESRARLDTLKTAHQAARAATLEALAPRRQKEAQIQDARDEAARLEAMSRDKGNPLAGFDHRAVEVHRVVEANLHRFRVPPLGPVGQYLKLKPGTSEVHQKLVNSCPPLQKMLNAFVVASNEDERLLRNMLPRNLKPNIFTVRPDTYDVRRISPSEQFATVLRCLDVSESRIEQAIIEWASVHAVGLAASPEEAQQTMRRNPHNLDSMVAPHKSRGDMIVHVTQKGYQLTSSKVFRGLIRVGKVTVSAEEVAEVRAQADSYRGELQALVRAHQQCEQQEAICRREVSEFETESMLLSQKLQDLRRELALAESERETIPDAPTVDETDAKIEMKTEEVANSQRQLAEAQEALVSNEARQVELAEAVARTQSELEGLKETKQEQAAQYDKVHTDMGAVQDLVGKTELKIQIYEERIADLDEAEQRLRKDMEDRRVSARLASEEPVPLASGIAMEDGIKYCMAQRQKIDARIVAAKERNVRDYREVYTEFQNAEDEYAQAKRVLDVQSKEVRTLSDTEIDRLNVRGLSYGLHLSKLEKDFKQILQAKAVTANIKEDWDAKKLSIDKYRLANASGDNSQGARDVTTTSGGEHSYLQAALMSAMWKLVDTPIVCLDEYEVFMDDATRVTAQKNLVRTLSGLRQRAQAILISPTVVKNTNLDDPRFVYVEVRDPDFTRRR